MSLRNNIDFNGELMELPNSYKYFKRFLKGLGREKNTYFRGMLTKCASYESVLAEKRTFESWHWHWNAFFTSNLCLAQNLARLLRDFDYLLAYTSCIVNSSIENICHRGKKSVIIPAAIIWKWILVMLTWVSVYRRETNGKFTKEKMVENFQLLKQALEAIIHFDQWEKSSGTNSEDGYI